MTQTLFHLIGVIFNDKNYIKEKLLPENNVQAKLLFTCEGTILLQNVDIVGFKIFFLN